MLSSLKTHTVVWCLFFFCCYFTLYLLCGGPRWCKGFIELCCLFLRLGLSLDSSEEGVFEVIPVYVIHLRVWVVIFVVFHELLATAVVWYCCDLYIRNIPGNCVWCLHQGFGCARGSILGTFCWGRCICPPMFGACTALAVKDVLPRILVLMPVSGQHLIVFFDVALASGTQKYHWCCMCILFCMFYGRDFEICVPVYIAARVVSELPQPFPPLCILMLFRRFLSSWSFQSKTTSWGWTR